MRDRPQTSKAAGSNRRNYFRINHDLVFDYRPVDAYQANNGDPASAFEDSASLGLAAELRRIDRSAAQTLKALAEKDPVLGEYLRLMSRKLDLIARHTLLADTAPETGNRQRVNLSEAGIAFRSEKAFYKGKFLAVRLIFLPGYVPITGFVEVIRCDARTAAEDQQNEEYEIAARFHRLTEKDRQELSRQIIRAQVAHRKAGTAARSTTNNKASHEDHS